MTTVLLHGFWGSPRDWNQVLAKVPLGAQVVAPDLFETPELAPKPFDTWVKNFWGWIDHHVGREPIQLVGYSMGGRLAVAATLAASSRVKRALYLSANPLLPLEAKPDREAWERKWISRFSEAKWEELEKDWQEQDVFAGDAREDRRHADELRAPLVAALQDWSALRHPFSWVDVKELPAQAEWAFGALDQKYQKVAKNLQELPVRGQITRVANAGHRLPFAAPEFIADWISK